MCVINLDRYEVSVGTNTDNLFINIFLQSIYYNKMYWFTLKQTIPHSVVILKWQSSLKPSSVIHSVIYHELGQT